MIDAPPLKRRADRQRRAALIGFPMDLGGNTRGVDMGPSAIRLTELALRLAEIGIETTDLGNVLVHTRALVEAGQPDAHFLNEILRAADSAAEMTQEALSMGAMPIVLGGDHSVAIGSLWGMAQSSGPGGVIWIDAHADLNTPATSPSGNVHGMPLAVALGLCADDPRFRSPSWPERSVLPQHTVLVGIRDLDPGEREFLQRPDAPRVFTMAEIDRRGIAAVAEEAISIASGAPFLHVSLDMDAVDPNDAPGVGTAVRGGLSYREAHTLLETIASKAQIDSADVVEVNPVLDERNRTAQLATELTCSLLGKTIL